MFFFGDKEVSFPPGCPLRCPIKQCRQHIAFRPRPQTPAEREFRKWRGCRTVSGQHTGFMLFPVHLLPHSWFCSAGPAWTVWTLQAAPGHSPPTHPRVVCSPHWPGLWPFWPFLPSNKQAVLSLRIRHQNQQEEKANKEDEAFFSK